MTNLTTLNRRSRRSSDGPVTIDCFPLPSKGETFPTHKKECLVSAEDSPKSFEENGYRLRV